MSEGEYWINENLCANAGLDNGVVTMKKPSKYEIKRMNHFIAWVSKNYPNVVNDYWEETGGNIEDECR